jgi:2-pyrone-4,6-dicarboxylate lactonase
MVQMDQIPTPAAPACAGYDPTPRPLAETLPPHACDTHFHIFGPLDVYPYIAGRSYTPPEAPEAAYRRLLATYGFQRAVHIQPSVYGTDNRRMMALLETPRADDPIEWRGVAVVDTHVTDAELEAMHARGVRGIRLNLLFRGGVDFDTVAALAARIAPLGWHVQFLIDVSRFPDLARRLGGLPVDTVVDHMGHLPADRGLTDPGFRALLALVRDGRTWVKLSGAYRLSARQTPPYSDVDPIARALIEANADRMVFGTDWPHPGIQKPMPNDADMVTALLRWTDYDPSLLSCILVDNPARLYDFEDKDG